MSKYMQRALQLASNGFPSAFPNPMVGAVITAPDGTVIGEGWHRRCGEAHAEVNAIASVKDPAMLRDATMYVTLEPCAHYGRTPPCAQLIIDKRIPRVVVGCRDPFGKVDGKGIEMMRRAGIEVTTGVMEQECRSLNAVFFTAHSRHRPFVLLKWAQSADGYMDVARDASAAPALFSSALTSTLTHRLRAMTDAILVGSGTVIADSPSLTTRLWPGKSPRPVTLDRRCRITPASWCAAADPLIIHDPTPLPDLLADLYSRGISSLMVEGGARILQSFIDSGLWDMARVETAPVRLGASGAAPAPVITSSPGRLQHTCRRVDSRVIDYYTPDPTIDLSAPSPLLW